MFKKITRGWLVLLIVLVLGLFTATGIYSDARTAAEKAFKIGERVVNRADTSLKIENELSSLATGIREYCQDEIDPATGELISEGYFKYTIDKNTLKVEVDKETGYTIGEAHFSVSFSRKCPGLLGDSLLPKSGIVTGKLLFTGHKAERSNKIKGKYKFTADVPPKISSKGTWSGEVSGDKVSGSFPITAGISKYKVTLDIPFSTNLSETTTDYQLIKFEVVESKKKKVNFLEPYKVELKAEGLDEYQFTVKVANEAKLLNVVPKPSQTIDIIEAGVENESIKVQKDEFLPCCELSPRDLEWGTIDNVTTTLDLITDADGMARFTYKTPDIDEKKFKSGRVILQVLHKDGNPSAYITLQPQMGVIKGKLVTLDGKNFPEDVKLILKDPKNKIEKTILKGGKGEFELETNVPENNYKLTIDPPTGVTGRMIDSLPFNVDLGEIVIGSVEDYEKEVIRKTREFLKKSGISAFVNTSQLEDIEFVYDQVGEACSGAEACFKNGKIYLQSEKYWMEMSNEHLETVYHEIFHGIHSFISYDDVNWAQKLIDQKNKYFFGLGTGGSHSMWEESKSTLWKLNNTELAFDEAISHFMANLMLKEQQQDYLGKTMYQGFSLFNMFGNTGRTAPREDYYQLASVDSNNVNKDGSITEGKIVGFLLDYYQFKGMSNGEIMQDFFITLRDYGGMNEKHSARDIRDWIVAKVRDARANNNEEDILHLYEMASIHNIVVPGYRGLTDYEMIFNPDGKRSVDFSLLNARFDGLEKQLDAIEKNDKAVRDAVEKQKATAEHSADVDVGDINLDGVNITTDPDDPKDFNVGDTKYEVGGGSSFNINPAGGVNLKSGSVMVNNGPISTDKAVMTDAGTKYLVKIVDGKTVVRVGEGMVNIYNKESGKKYLAEAGEEVEIDGSEINGVMTFDPKTDDDFKTSILSLTNILLLVGGLGILGLIAKLLRRKK